MAIFPLTVYTGLKTVLEDSAYLSYVDTITIQKFRQDSMPNFDYYCIVISPQLASLVVYPAHQRYVENLIHLILLGKMLNGEADAILADQPGITPPNVGILAMYEDVILTLYNNDLGGAIELQPGIRELDEASDFNVFVTEDREGFIMETKIVYKPRGERFVSLP
jgi:hypothetical protein